MICDIICGMGSLMELRVVRDKQPLWSGISCKTIMQYFEASEMLPV